MNSPDPVDPLLALLQLSSPSLPVGAFSYSQGLESAVEGGLVSDASSAQRWIGECLELVVGRYEAPLWLRLNAALSSRNWPLAQRWNQDYFATRESAELLAEARQMGYSAARWLDSLDQPLPPGFDPPSFVAAHAWACVCWDIQAAAGLRAYLFAWAENQMMAALKLVPLGQAAGQRLLQNLRARIAAVADQAADLEDADLSTQAPGFALASCHHEIQYSRLFRS